MLKHLKLSVLFAYALIGPKKGIGYASIQKHCDCKGAVDPHCGGGHWKLVYAGSRFTRDAESRYAPIEGEALALVYGL